MFADGFKSKYTTIPFATYKNRNEKAATLYAHYHKELEIITVIEGAIDFFVGSEPYEVTAGEVIIIPPYAVHRAAFKPGTRHECICFDLSVLWDERLRRDLEKGVLTINTHLTLQNPETENVYRLVSAAFAANQEKNRGWELEAIGNLSVAFGRLSATSFFVKNQSADTEADFTRSVVEYVKEHFDEQITSTTAAEHLHLNNSYFCRLFKRDFGCCFAEYLTSYRIERSKMLLNKTDDSISEVAIKCGFNGFSYFSKIFKETIGITPSQYRKKRLAVKKQDKIK